MRIDANLASGRPGDAAPEPAAQSGDRWLAQLEKACLGAWHAGSSPAHADGRDADAPPRRDPTPEPQAGEVPDTPRGAAPPALAGSGLPTLQEVLASAPAALALAPRPAYAGLQLSLAPDVAADAPGDGSVAEAPRPQAANIGTRSTLARGLVPQADDGGTAGEAAGAPPRYARQFMQLSLTEPERAQASLRDASLSAADAAAVARGVAAQLRSDGVVLQRVFINGRRFDVAASHGDGAAPERHTNQSQE